MNAKICHSIPTDFTDIKNYEIKNAVADVTCDAAESYNAVDEAKFNVTVVDYGVKKSIIAELCKRGCNVKVVPASTSAADILTDKPDGVILSGGPGDPADNTDYIVQIKQLMGNVPMFGIGLGHQMMALANGAQTVKLKYGHRGGNQPSHKVGTNRTFITAQNNGYAVNSDTVKVGALSYVNANDNTCEGIDYNDIKAFSVQFYPESIEGLHSTAFLYDRFIEMMGGN
jgi:carbamoyl-phosphate synthase small subunit